MKHKKVGVIGDVHGCINEFKKLVNLMADDGVTSFISLGDLVDRGPNSKGAVLFWRDIKKEFGDSILVRGNHDDKTIRAAKHTYNFLKSGLEIKMDLGHLDKWQLAHVKVKNRAVLVSNLVSVEDPDEESEVISILNDSVIAHRIDDRYAFVHGGISPTLHGWPRNPEKVRDLMFCRNISKIDGRPIKFGDEDKIPYVFWGEIYDGRFGKVFFGHQPHSPDEVFKHNHCVAMDTGCAFGDALSGVVLSVDSGDMNLIQVSAEAKYAEKKKIRGEE